MDWQELLCVEVTPLPGILVIFGATGDLARRKLFPALAELEKRGLLHGESAIVACGRRPFEEDDFQRQLGLGGALRGRITYLQGDNRDDATYERLAELLKKMDRKSGDFPFNHLFYLALGPEDSFAVTQALFRHGLLREEPGKPWRHVILEKPFGRDLESAEKLNLELHRMLPEAQIYRIDHYLGKETVQNILMLRFANVILEPLWSREYIRKVEITAAEELGVENRGRYYDHTGALRDMVQNHMLQLLALIAMETPNSFEADAVREEKVRVLRAIRPFDLEHLDREVVRAQYTAGDGLPGYREEKDIAPSSATETFAAVRLMIDNWRWRDVPFYLRTGKRLSAKKSEIAITFRHVPHSIFPGLAPEDLCADTLVLRIHPEEGVALSLQAKKPGPKLCLGRMTLHFDSRELEPERTDDAYARLLLDAMLGDQSLFIHSDFIEAAWKLLTPVLRSWEQEGTSGKLAFYPAHSAGPAEAGALTAPDEWRPLSDVQRPEEGAAERKNS